MSYFNKVRPEWIHTYIRIRSRELADLMIKIIANIRYHFDRPIDKLPEEAEIRIMGKSRIGEKVKPLIVRSGIPQGLSISPLLATLMLEIIKPPKGIIMYADDGIFINDEKSEEFKV